MFPCATQFTFSSCLFHPSCLPSSVARDRTAGLLAFIVILLELAGRPCTRVREVSFLFPTASVLLHGNKVNTTSAVDVTEPVRFVPWWTRLSTLLRSPRIGGSSLNLSKDFCFLECKTQAGMLSWAVCWVLMAEALQGGTAVVPDCVILVLSWLCSCFCPFFVSLLSFQCCYVSWFLNYITAKGKAPSSR